MTTIRTTTLENGLRVVSDPMATVESASIGVWVGVGTRYEKPELSGVSHLLEHMAFKGTRKRSALAIAEEIEAVGGHINAYTTRESTAYYVRVLKEDVPLGVDLIADILQNSTMENEELERERTVILQEISQANDTPDDVVFDNFQAAAFPDQPLGRQVLGDADIVGAMDRETIIDYMSGHYNANTMILAAAGRIDHDQLVVLARETFGALPAGEQAMRESANYTGGESIIERELEQAHLLLGFEGVGYQDPDFYTAAVLSTLFGGGMSSRLFQEIREKRGLCYSIYSFVPSYSDTGLFGIYAGTGEEETAELVPLICDEIKKMTDSVGTDELIRARAQIKASILMSLESSSSRCEQLARQMMVFGRPMSTEEIVANIEAVDADAILRAARRIFTSPLTVAALGPVSRLESFQEIAHRIG
ncbi:MAG: insulinase family protein [Rhodospirillales bacterium]|nr:insulinase family protein [Rhodospirillales bacterium]